MQKKNHLANETSPYLLQHVHNPVDWYPWGEEALGKAKEENKLLIISVGYAACHWCHVMEHESFEDDSVAKVMNKGFVSIKVDREERPDIDQIYMDAVQLMTGQGGWPMNVVALPDGRPIWGGTYFPKENWIDALHQLSDFYQKDPIKAEEYAQQLQQGMQSMNGLIPAARPGEYALADLDSMVNPWKKQFDLEDGGLRRSRNKFPMPNNYLFLQEVACHTGDEEVEEILDITLKKIAWGGIYDQLGGGFARYSVDSLWIVPHFEKMMYDNGQLVSLYSKAYLRDPKPLYKRTVYQTLEWVKREMTSPEGGFYSSLDADSDGEEGKFYVWTQKELRKYLPGDWEWFGDYYNCTPRGNFEEGQNVLYASMSRAEFAEKMGWEEEKLERKLLLCHNILMQARDKRNRPGLDDKILASWNALMISGYLDAYRVFGEEEFLATAKTNAEFIRTKMRNGKGLFRNYKEGRATINAFLDDYALVIQASLDLFEVTGDRLWLDFANELKQETLDHFWSEEHQMFYYTSDEDPELITRKFETADNVIPASNSVMARNLFRLSHLLDSNEHREKAFRMLAGVRENLLQYPGGFSNWGALMLTEIFPYYEVVIAGPEARALVQELDRAKFLPNKLVIVANSEPENPLPLQEKRFVENVTRIYVCQNKTCQLPVETVAAALDQMQ